ncbi:LLM class F420-dependent oxidoreductase [Actinocorallia sp. A-T 12471]|uniref:LLM class F420-dependent oxidoreductase n=1 Tax=Actinocorallia sp. A-T 12471 TaxID=3089813 RepID=UPI0029D37CC9|nr:LLM class F420-dependent oxidoreductase [Actinocorallia sp. A-T 12471]MDX6743091.1 LLM class F420-dependent oxidoreductase [Actinocorallia sp. A-T 12471]
MRIGMPLGYAGGFKEAVTELIDFEKAGLDIVYVPEAYSFDAVSQLGYIAAKTERLQIASGILNIYSRTPALMAMTAAGVDYVSDGRFTLGLGASGPQVIEGFHGLPYHAPLGRTREVIEICRQVWKREAPLSYEGKYYTLPLPAEQGTGLGKALKIINHPVRPSIPVEIAAIGEKNVELAAEIADGWQPIFFLPEKANDVWGDSLARGKAKRDASLGDLGVAVATSLAIGDDVEGFLDFGRPMLALYIGGMGAKGKNFYNSLCRRYGWEKEAEEIQELYLSGKKAEAAEKVPAELLKNMSLIGPESWVKERIAAFKEAGVTTLNITPVAADHKGKLALIERIKTLTEEV